MKALTSSHERLGRSSRDRLTVVSSRATAPAGAFVEFAKVSKSYDGERLAIADLNLQIAKSEFLTLLGPSGSGKTTALMMLAGFETPTSGEILLKGRSLTRVPPHRRNIGVVFQNYALFPHMTVTENVAFPLRVRGVPRARAQERVERALKIVRLSALGTRQPAQLSGGQQQRVALARAMVFEPDLILMDEPLGALDRQLRDQLQIEIKQIQRNLGVTVVYVTHDQYEALTMSDRIAIFNRGTLEQLGTPEDIYERPRSAFVAQFVGESNQLDATIVAVQNDRWVVRTDKGLVIHACTSGTDAAPGRVRLAIRPERMVLGSVAVEQVNCFDAVAEQVIYQGDQVRVQLRLPAGCSMFVRLRNARGSLGLAPGEAIKVGWAPQDCRAFAIPLDDS